MFIEPKYLSISYVLGMKFAVNVIFGCKHSPCASSPYGKFPKKSGTIKVPIELINNKEANN